MRILSVFVLFHPDQELLEKGIKGIAEYVDRILLWENSKVDHSIIAHSPLVEKVDWVGSGNNEGISTALNYAWKYAVQHGYDYLLTMDQDSVFVGFDNYINNIQLPKNPQGIFGPGVNWMAFAGGLSQYDFLITSGMLVPTVILNQLGGYRSEFKVDGIDLDFTLRAKEAGIPTYLVGDCALLQHFGTKKNRKVFFKHFQIDSYPPSRLYSIYKNLRILLIEHPYPSWKRHYRQRFGFRNILKRVVVEDHPLSIIRAILKGIHDGKRSCH